MVFLHAGVTTYKPTIPNQWFDITSLKNPALEQEKQAQGLAEHAKHLRELIDAEIAAGIPADKIVLMGLSQGCATSLFFLLSTELRLGAVVGMSGWLPFEPVMNDLLTELSPSSAERPVERGHALEALRHICQEVGLPLVSDSAALGNTPVFLGHGTADDRVSVRLGEAARDTLRRLGFGVTWQAYEGWGHWWKAPDEIDDVLGFLERAVGVKIGDEKPPAMFK